MNIRNFFKKKEKKQTEQDNEVIEKNEKEVIHVSDEKPVIKNRAPRIKGKRHWKGAYQVSQGKNYFQKLK